MTLPAEDLEAVWEALAAEIDAAGERDRVFLAKLALLMAEEIGDRALVEALIRVARTEV